MTDFEIAPIPADLSEVVQRKRMARDIEIRLLSDLQRDLGLTLEQAAGVVGSLMKETDNFQTQQEYHPVVKGSQGGYGFAMWTGSRRIEFEAYADRHGLERSSYEANYGFMLSELTSPFYRDDLRRLRQSRTVEEATEAFTGSKDSGIGYLRPGIPHLDDRLLNAKWVFQLADADRTPIMRGIGNARANFAPNSFAPDYLAPGTFAPATMYNSVRTPDGIAPIPAEISLDLALKREVYRRNPEPLHDQPLSWPSQTNSDLVKSISQEVFRDAAAPQAQGVGAGSAHGGLLGGLGYHWGNSGVTQTAQFPRRSTSGFADYGGTSSSHRVRRGAAPPVDDEPLTKGPLAVSFAKGHKVRHRSTASWEGALTVTPFVAPPAQTVAPSRTGGIRLVEFGKALGERNRKRGWTAGTGRDRAPMGGAGDPSARRSDRDWPRLPGVTPEMQAIIDALNRGPRTVAKTDEQAMNDIILALQGPEQARAVNRSYSNGGSRMPMRDIYGRPRNVYGDGSGKERYAV